MLFKRLSALFLTLILLVSFTACNKTNPDDSSGYTSGITSVETESNNNLEDKNDLNDSDSSSEDGDEEKNESQIKPLLYKVSDDKGNYIWLFGSIHVGEEYYYPLPDYVLDAFDSSDCLSVEIDMVALEKDTALMTKAISRIIYTDGTTIKDHLSADVYDEGVKILKDNKLYFNVMDHYMPALWGSLIDNILYEKIGAKPELGIDMHLLNRAYDQEKPVREVESAEFQYGMMADFSPELQEQLLKESINNYLNRVDESKEELKMLSETWAKGDEAQFEKVLNEEPEFKNDNEKKLYEEYNKALIIDRNLGMTHYAEQAIASGKKVFICVGAAHIVGKGAMAELLEERGYKVELIR